MPNLLVGRKPYESVNIRGVASLTLIKIHDHQAIIRIHGDGWRKSVTLGKGDSVKISDDVKLTIGRIRPARANLIFTAPADIIILRSEIDDVG